MKFKVGDVVNCDNYVMDGCCHDCEGTSHYLEFHTFVILEIIEDFAFHKDSEDGYYLADLKHVSPLEQLL